MDQGLGRWNYNHATTNPHRVALVRDDDQRTYAELNERTNRLASALEQRGVSKGDRVCILSTNSIEFLELLFAVAKLGAITVPINFRLAGPEVAYVLKNSRPKAFFVSANLADLAGAALKDPEVTVDSVVVMESPEPIQIGEVDGIQYEELMSAGDPADNERDVAKDDVAMIMYTSGTTGRPKGAMLTHRNFEANNLNIMAMADGISKYDVTTTPAPLFHIGGLAVHTLPLLYLGGKTVILPSFVPQESLKAMAQSKATVQFLVPAMWAALMQAPDFDDYDLSSMRFGMSGGAPCPITVIEFFQSKGWNFTEGFGMTETCAGCLTLNMEDTVTRAGSVGQSTLLTDARVVGPDGESLGAEAVGELVVRGDNIFIGYWEMEEATKDAIRDGWFYTGDLAKLSVDGYFTLVDRKKDMVITGGENVYPIEIEQVLHRHPDVADVAVIGVPSERWGETVMAVIVPAPGKTIDKAEIIAYSRENLAHFKCPTLVEVIAELPRNATGKILKRDLREQFTGRGEAVTR